MRAATASCLSYEKMKKISDSQLNLMNSISESCTQLITISTQKLKRAPPYQAPAWTRLAGARIQLITKTADPHNQSNEPADLSKSLIKKAEPVCNRKFNRQRFQQFLRGLKMIHNCQLVTSTSQPRTKS